MRQTMNMATLLPTPHKPHSITDRLFWAGLESNPRTAAAIAQFKKEAEALPAKPPCVFASDYLAAQWSNERSRLDTRWQTDRRSLSLLILRRALLGLPAELKDAESRDERLLDWLWTFLHDPTWAVSAHLPNFDLPASDTPTLDLASCEMAAFLAETREVLLPWMRSISKTLADSIIVEIDRRILTPYAEGAKVWWQDAPADRVNNWAGVCAGSILVAACSLEAQGHPRPKAKSRALAGLQEFAEHAFTPSGECDEGVGYFNYGLGFACLGWSRLSQEELQREAPLARLKQVAAYPGRANLFANYFFCGNDATAQDKAPLHFVPWLAEVTGNEFLAEWAAKHPEYTSRHFGMLTRCFDAPELPGHSDMAKVPTQALSVNPPPQILPDQQAAILRVPTSMGEMVVALAGGTNAERHNHNDLGHFTLALDGKIILPDLGAPWYHSDFFGAKRYTYLSASSRGHNCPLIGEFEQRAGAAAAGKVIEWPSATPGKNEKGERLPQRFVLDLTSAYPPEAGLLSWIRSLEIRPAGANKPVRVVIKDQFKTKEPGTRITHSIWSLESFFEQHQHPEGGGVRIKLGPLFGEFSPSPVVVGSSDVRPEDHSLRQFKGQILHRIDAVYRTDKDGALDFETRFYVAGY